MLCKLVKKLMNDWRRFFTEEIRVLLATKKYVCPPATQDLKLNTKNRDALLRQSTFNMVHSMLMSQETIGKTSLSIGIQQRLLLKNLYVLTAPPSISPPEWMSVCQA